MEQYLIDDYNVIEDVDYLKSEDDIEEYMSDMYDEYDMLKCGQGYYNDFYTGICKIGDKFYSFDIEAHIGSAKQDYGDRLYWIEKITSVTYKEIPKPQPKPRDYYTYSFYITKSEKFALDSALKKLRIENQLS